MNLNNPNGSVAPARLEAVSANPAAPPEFESLLLSIAPEETAWVARAHESLARRFPEQYVVRLDESLTDLSEWLAALGVVPESGQLRHRIDFDLDRDAPHVQPEGGTIVFRWSERTFTVFALRVSGPRYYQTLTWMAAPDEAAARALVDALGRFEREKRHRVMVFEDGEWGEAPRLEADLAAYSWDSVVLPAGTRERLQRVSTQFFRSGSVYSDLGVPWKLGMIFVGPPGTGKTLTTKVLAATCEVPFLYARRLTDCRGGEPDPETVRDLFQGARDRAPCILCLEDVDALVTEGLRTTFLNEMDGLEEDYRGVLTVATTNHPEKLDAALLHRPSRFDYRIEFPLPDEFQRRAFVLHWTEKLCRLGYVESASAAVDAIVSKSRGMSPAYLKRVMMAAAMRLHIGELRGDEAFTTVVLEELADAIGDRNLMHRMDSSAEGMLNGQRIGFRTE